MSRETGIYKVRQGAVWFFAEYFDDENRWHVPGSDIKHMDDDFDQIDPVKQNPVPADNTRTIYGVARRYQNGALCVIQGSTTSLLRFAKADKKDYQVNDKDQDFQVVAITEETRVVEECD